MDQTNELTKIDTIDIEKILKEKELRQIVFEDLTHNARAKATLRNFELLLTHYGIKIRYNEMSKEYEIDIPHRIFHTDIQANAKMAVLRSYAHYQGFPVTEIDNYVIEVGERNSYHPVRDWIDNQTWDGVDRLQSYYDSIILEEPNTMKERMMYKWALSLVAALYHPNFSCEGVLTLTGEQGKGKTIWIENLIPREYRNIWNKDAVVIDTKNKDSLTKALKYWIAELGEIDATFRKTDIEALKGFLTEKVDVIRNPYEKKANTYQRRTVFYATVNEEEFLRDTQNRRFWVLSVKGFNHGPFDDVGQFWAQMKHIYMSIRDKIHSAGDREKFQEWGWFMSPSERQLMEPLQERYKTVDPVEEILEAYLEPSTCSNGEYMNCTQILKECNFGTPNKQSANTASKWLKKNGYQKNWKKEYFVKFKLSTDNVVDLEKVKSKNFGRL
jgi:putative DNA primase/helicase